MQFAFDRSVLTLGFSTRGKEDYSLWCAEAGVATEDPAVHRMSPAVNTAPCHQHQGGESLSLSSLWLLWAISPWLLWVDIFTTELWVQFCPRGIWTHERAFIL